MAHLDSTNTADKCTNITFTQTLFKNSLWKRVVPRARHYKVLCSTLGCPSKVRARGLCMKHGAHRVCLTAGCEGTVYAHGVCKKHGAKGFCSFGNCNTAAVSKGRCFRHGSGRTKECTVKECNTLALTWGVKHGAYGSCTTKGCTANARSGYKNCYKHGGQPYTPCSVVGCISTCRRKGLCRKHDGY